MSTIKQGYFPIYIFFLLIILLSLININSYLTHNNRVGFYMSGKKVLGAETKNDAGVFWYTFLQKNPNYIPGWIEIGRPDKAKAIDPNYF